MTIVQTLQFDRTLCSFHRWCSSRFVRNAHKQRLQTSLAVERAVPRAPVIRRPALAARQVYIGANFVRLTAALMPKLIKHYCDGMCARDTW